MATRLEPLIPMRINASCPLDPSRAQRRRRAAQSCGPYPDGYRRRVPVVPGRVDDQRLTEMAVAARSLPYSYAEVGATQGPLPAGYQVDRHSIALGRGRPVLDRAADGLRDWQAHRRAGVRVAPDDAQELALARANCFFIARDDRESWQRGDLIEVLPQ